MDQTGLLARRAAHHLLQEVTIWALLSELIDKVHLITWHLIAPIGLRRSTGADCADRMLKPHLKKRPPLFVQNALRLGVTSLPPMAQRIMNIIEQMQ